MADGIFSKLAQKTGHVFGQMGGLLVKGLRIGAAIGALVGVGVAFAALGFTMPLLVWGAVAAGAGGMLGGLTGGAIGSALGTLKGVFTRAKPDGDKIIEDAVAKGMQPSSAGVEQLQAMPAMSQSIPRQIIRPQAQPVGKITPTTLSDLQQMTAELNTSQLSGSWGQRVRPDGPQQLAGSWSERTAQQPQASSGVSKV